MEHKVRFAEYSSLKSFNEKERYLKIENEFTNRMVKRKADDSYVLLIGKSVLENIIEPLFTESGECYAVTSLLFDTNLGFYEFTVVRCIS